MNKTHTLILGFILVPILCYGTYLSFNPKINEPKPQYYVGQLYTLEPEGTTVKILTIYRYDRQAGNWRYLVRYKGQLIEAYERELRTVSQGVK